MPTGSECPARPRWVRGIAMPSSNKPTILIRHLLGALFGILGLLGAALSCQSLHAAWDKFGRAGQIALAASADQFLLRAIQVARFERGDTATMLRAQPDQVEKFRREVVRYRAILDTSIAAALPLLERADIAGLPTAADELKRAYADFKGLREKAEAAMVQPL